jgi:hypothetical protein
VGLKLNGTHQLLVHADDVNLNKNKHPLNSVAVARKRTIPTERPPLVGDVSAEFCG